MKTKLSLGILMLLLFLPFAIGGEKELKVVSGELNAIIAKASAEVPELGNSEPDGKLTKLLNELYQKMGELEKADVAENEQQEQINLLEKGETLFLLLSERRIFRYMLWAEKRLRHCVSRDLSKLSQGDLFDLYKSLSDINLSLIPEAILSREITTQLAAIYDRLDAEHKPEARLESIRRNADKELAQKNRFARRKGLDDF